MLRLSVNINKVALIRNAREGNLPNLVQFAKDCELFGADGITVHPRPDERHIRFSDVPEVKEVVTTEFNIEGYPTEKFIELIKTNHPDQCTLVPDGPDVLTSAQGWNTVANASLLKECIYEIKQSGTRVSLFMENDVQQIDCAKAVGADRIELYTGPYARQFSEDRHKAIEPYKEAAKTAATLGLGINAGHDLNLQNLRFFAGEIENLLEVSIGHALISDALYVGIEKAIGQYKSLLHSNLPV